MQPLRILALFILFVSSGLAQVQTPLRVDKTESSNAFKLHWQSAIERSYFIQHSGDLLNWDYFPEVIPGIGGDDWMGVVSSADKGFFRLLWSSIPTHDILTADHDGDGIPSFAEFTVTNTDPLKYSTAGNGISDRVLFPNPQNGIYIDSSNAIQYVILPNSPGTTGSPTIMATHYYEAPDCVIEFKKGEKNYKKEGYPEFTGSSSKRFLKWKRYIWPTDLNGQWIDGNWQFGETQGQSYPLTRFVMADYNSEYTNSINPQSGTETITGAGFGNTYYYTTTSVASILNNPWGGQYSNWRWIWFPSYYTNNRYLNYDLPPYSTLWDGQGLLYYVEARSNENTITNVGLIAKSNPPSFPGTWTEGNPWATWDHWSNDLGVTYSRAKFRIKNRGGIADGEPAQVFVYFDPEGGEREQVTHFEWDGQGATSPEYEIDPATLRSGIEGTFHLNAGSMFFELDLAQADARKAGETVMIPVIDGGAATNTMMRSVSAVASNTGNSTKIMFPGMDDTWYEDAEITLSQIGGTGAVRFKAVDPQSGYEINVPMGQNLASDFFESRGSYSGFDWKIEGVNAGSITVQLTYSKGTSNLVVARTAVVLGKSTLLTDIDNDGVINEDDDALRITSLVPGASSTQMEFGSEYLFFNDGLSNGAWDKEDGYSSRPTNATADDDAQAISLHAGVTEGEVWFTHPAIAGLSFYLTRECNIADRIEIHESNRFIIVPNRPLPSAIYVRADNPIEFPSDLQITGDLVLNLKYSANDPVLALAALKLTVVKEFGATKFFHAAYDYITENNTELFVHDKGFPVNSTNPTARLRVSVLRASGTTMLPYEAYQPNYDFWLASGSPGGGFDVTTNRIAAGLQEVAALDPDITLIANGNLCDFSSGISALEAAALSVIGMPLMTDKCHGNMKELNRAINGASSTHYDSETNAPGTNMKGHRFAGPDPIPGTSPPVPGGKYLAQYDDMSFLFGPGHAESALMLNTPAAFSVNLTQFGGLATNYGDPEKDTAANQMVGFFRAADEDRKMVFMATDLVNPSGVPGYVGQIYNAAKASGVADLDGATHVAGSLKPIELLLLDGGTSTSLAYKNQSGNIMNMVSQSKNTGFPYYINTFLRFKSIKPRP